MSSWYKYHSPQKNCAATMPKLGCPLKCRPYCENHWTKKEQTQFHMYWGRRGWLGQIHLYNKLEWPVFPSQSEALRSISAIVDVPPDNSVSSLQDVSHVIIPYPQEPLLFSYFEMTNLDAFAVPPFENSLYDCGYSLWTVYPTISDLPRSVTRLSPEQVKKWSDTWESR